MQRVVGLFEKWLGLGHQLPWAWKLFGPRTLHHAVWNGELEGVECYGRLWLLVGMLGDRGQVNLLEIVVVGSKAGFGEVTDAGTTSLVTAANGRRQCVAIMR